MRKANISSLAMCVALCSAQQAVAQQLKASEEHEILLKVVELFEDYERYSAIDEDFTDYAASFRELFVSGNAPVYNDIVGLAGGPELTVRDYVDALATQSSTTRTLIRNISHQPIKMQNGVCRVVCTFEKSVNVTNQCGVEFASDFIYDQACHKLTATIRYDAKTGLCRFERIDGVAPDHGGIPDDFMVLKWTDDINAGVNVNGKRIGKSNFNEMQQAFISGSANVTSADPEASIKLVPENEACNIWKVKYTPRHWRAKLHYDITIGDFYSISSAFSGLESSSTATELGLDFGYLLNSKGKMRYAINFGVGYSSSQLNLDLGAGEDGGISYAYQCDQEANGLTYERHYEGVSAHENVKVGSVFVPITFDFERVFSPYLSAYLQVGVKNYLNLSSSLDNTTHINNIYGVFPAPYNGIIDHHYPFDGFRQNVDLGNADLVVDNVTPKAYSLDGIGAIGLRVHPVLQLPLYLDVSASYQMSVLPPFDLGTQDRTGEASCPLSTYHLNSDLTGYEQLNSLSSSIDTWRRQNLKVNIGLIYKF